MDGGISDAQANAWLQDIADNGWISLHFDDPSLGGQNKAEISGGGYSRFQMRWTRPSNRVIWGLVDARFTGLTQTKVTYFGIWDAQYKGMLRASALLPTPAMILSGKGYIIPQGQIAVSIG